LPRFVTVLGCAVDRKIRTRLAIFVRNLEGPLGKVPLDRAIRNDLALFQELRDSGASWIQISNALAAAGAQRADGSAITGDHLRSAVSRQLKRQTDEHGEPSAAHRSPPTTSKRRPPVAKKSPVSPSSSVTTQNDHHTRQKLPAAPTDATNKTSSVLQKLARTRQLRET